MIGIYSTLEGVNSKYFYSKQGIDGGSPMQFHDSFEMLYYIDGEHEATVNGTKKVLGPNEICFCNSFDVHQYRCFDKGGLYCIVFGKSYLSDGGKYFDDMRFQNFMQNTDKNKELLPLFLYLVEHSEECNFYEKSGYISILIGKLLSIYGTEKENIKDKDIVRNVIIYLNSKYKEHFDRDSIARIFGYAPTYFSHMFKKNTGVGLMDYLNTLRFENVRQMLSLPQSKKRSKLEIVLECGFESLPTYYRTAKKIGYKYSDMLKYYEYSDAGWIPDDYKKK